MADGDKVFEHRHILHYKLIDAAVATDNGVWIDTADYPEGCVHVTIAGQATVQIFGSNAAAVPGASTDHAQLGSDIVASGMFPVANSKNGAPRWIKCKVSAWTSGAVSAFLVLRRNTAN